MYWRLKKALYTRRGESFLTFSQGRAGMERVPGSMLRRSCCTSKTGITRSISPMPFQDPNTKLWTGQVMKTVRGDLFHLDGVKCWKKMGPDAWLYRKKKTKFRLKREASGWEKEHWETILLEQIYPKPEKPEPTPLVFSKICVDYLDLESPRWKGKRTKKDKIKLFNDAVAFWGYDPPLPLEPLLIRQFITHLFKTKTDEKANRSLRELNTLFRWAVANHYISENPASAVDPFASDGFKKYVPPAEHIAAAVQVASGWEKDLLRLAYHTLARSIEIRRLKWADVDFTNRKVWFNTRKRKGGKLARGSVIMNKILHEILTRRYAVSESEYVFPAKGGGQITEATLSNVMPRLMKKLNNEKTIVQVKYDRRTKYGVIKQTGTRVKWIPKPEEDQIPPFGLHSIRHHVAAHLYLNHGYTVARLQKRLRHLRASTTEEYIKSIVDMPDPGGADELETDNFETINPQKEEKRIIAYPDGH
jgi:integrase